MVSSDEGDGETFDKEAMLVIVADGACGCCLWERLLLWACPLLEEEGLKGGGVAVMVEVGGVSCSRSFLSCFVGGVAGVAVGFIVSTGCMLKQEITHDHTEVHTSNDTLHTLTLALHTKSDTHTIQNGGTEKRGIPQLHYTQLRSTNPLLFKSNSFLVIVF